MERLACSTPTTGVCPRKVSNLSDRFHHNPLSLDHPTTGSGGRGVGWGWGSCWCRALPGLWHRKNTWRVTACGERGSRGAPPPLRSPSSAQAAGSWEPGGCTGIWRWETGSGARLGELGSRAAEAWGPPVRALPSLGARRRRSRASEASTSEVRKLLPPSGYEPGLSYIHIFPSLIVC